MDRYLLNQLRTVEILDQTKRLQEAWFLGLRQNRGVDAAQLRREFGEDAFAQGAAADLLVEDGLLERNGDIYRLSPRGRMISNDVFERFITESCTRPEELVHA
jgi:oxygen-independent coproporphyrinogen-3 oxidase